MKGRMQVLGTERHASFGEVGGDALAESATEKLRNLDD